jgi:hypothetical protein
VAAPSRGRELAVGFFGSRYERATPAERDYMRAMAGLGDGPVATAEVAESLGRKPSSLSPAATPCSRRASSTPPNAAWSPSPCPTSANSSAPNTLAPPPTPRAMSTATTGPFDRLVDLVEQP